MFFRSQQYPCHPPHYHPSPPPPPRPSPPPESPDSHDAPLSEGYATYAHSELFLITLPGAFTAGNYSLDVCLGECDAGGAVLAGSPAHFQVVAAAFCANSSTVYNTSDLQVVAMVESALPVLGRDRYSNYLTETSDSIRESLIATLSSYQPSTGDMEHMESGDGWDFHGVEDTAPAGEKPVGYGGTYYIMVTVEEVLADDSWQYVLNLTHEGVPLHLSPYVLQVKAVACDMHVDPEDPSMLMKVPDSTGARCVCAPGYRDSASDEEACVRCSKGTFSERSGSTTCNTCGDHETTADSGAKSQAQCICEDGYVRRSDDPADAEECRVGWGGGNFTAGKVLSQVEALPGYWRAHADSWNFTDCEKGLTAPSLDNCLGGLSSVCADGYAGPLCAVCDEEYASSGSVCLRCEEGALIRELVLLVVALVLVLYLFPLFVRTRTRRIRENLDNQDFRNSGPMVLAKSLFTYIQMMGLIMEVEVDWAPVMQTFMHGMAHVGNLNESGAVKTAGCLVTVDYSHVFTMWMAAIPAAVLVPSTFTLSLALWRLCRHGTEFVRGKLPVMLSHLSNTLVFLIFLVYPSVVRSAVAVFPCTAVDDEDMYLSVDFSINCSSHLYRRMYYFAILFCCLYGIGIPIFLYLTLFRYPEVTPAWT
ncbi:hypothetical protein CYMTET_22130 [Cymbomonas tetramitiformis]|uniref:Tyrosine-protein kinase ephrin type A/B receptor-like domain-containing protein n=1 Tax=Cymbomonas tetramitiformis TaxID=36881 RepID=A0AAE0G0R2_9CHLO|nr:hypothetical protein CYMTET_22130 [Cymbomonas tetramitiformis]